MLVSQLGDLTSSQARRKVTLIGGGATSSAAPSRSAKTSNLTVGAATQLARKNLISAQNDLSNVANIAFLSGKSVAQTTADTQAKVAAAQALVDSSNKRLLGISAVAPPAKLSPLAPSSLVANALRNVKLSLTPATAAPATTAAAAAAAIPAPVTPTPALATTTSALTATPSGGGGGGGGGGDDLAPTDDGSAAPAPTGWAALSTSTKVIIVAGVAGVAFIGYKALRRR